MSKSRFAGSGVSSFPKAVIAAIGLLQAIMPPRSHVNSVFRLQTKNTKEATIEMPRLKILPVVACVSVRYLQ